MHSDSLITKAWAQPCVKWGNFGQISFLMPIATHARSSGTQTEVHMWKSNILTTEPQLLLQHWKAGKMKTYRHIPLTKVAIFMTCYYDFIQRTPDSWRYLWLGTRNWPHRLIISCQSQHMLQTVSFTDFPHSYHKKWSQYFFIAYQLNWRSLLLWEFWLPVHTSCVEMAVYISSNFFITW